MLAVAAHCHGYVSRRLASGVSSHEAACAAPVPTLGAVAAVQHQGYRRGAVPAALAHTYAAPPCLGPPWQQGHCSAGRAAAAQTPVEAYVTRVRWAWCARAFHGVLCCPHQQDGRVVTPDAVCAVESRLPVASSTVVVPRRSPRGGGLSSGSASHAGCAWCSWLPPCAPTARSPSPPPALRGAMETSAGGTPATGNHELCPHFGAYPEVVATRLCRGLWPTCSLPFGGMLGRCGHHLCWLSEMPQR